MAADREGAPGLLAGPFRRVNDAMDIAARFPTDGSAVGGGCDGGGGRRAVRGGLRRLGGVIGVAGVGGAPGRLGFH